VALAIAVAALVVACGGRRDGAGAEGVDVDASTDALPPGVAYVSGAYQCCEQDAGFQCCGPDDRACGAYQECTALGGGISAKLICSRCCAGLTPISPATVKDGQCVWGTDLESAFCAACGDGACRADQGENRCNCPADCP
jgi:hypothetical protein